ncbi:MAG TPA: hypothetical protein VKG82_07120 [Solirubrobacteraceae bacterium]|nr:hypothetical protein [Solirubrobacteraceae bacterium]
MFLVGSACYLWTAASTFPFSLAGGQTDYYNLLATALLHLHLSIGAAPAGLLHLADPYDPAQNAAYQGSYHDLSLYHGRFYLDWGPAPVVVLLIPLHLLGLAASSSLTAALFSVAGLAFALAALRVLLRGFDALPIWMGVLAGVVLVCSTSVPFLLRRPAIYEEAISGGFCFAMAGLFLALQSIAQRRASLTRLVLMSLCFGLAGGSRPPLFVLGLLVVPVYLTLRGTLPQRRLLAALLVPCGACLALLLAYNYARFGNPLEVGQSYNLAGYDPRYAHLGQAAYILPNMWFYGIAPPRATILFPFLALTPPPITYPLGLPSSYTGPEITGGLLTMTPILLFAFALPWLWRRRPESVGALAAPLLLAAGAGLFGLLFLSYEFFSSTERYEVDFAALFLFAGIAAWFALASGAPGRGRSTVRVAGAVLALWGCLTGLAISFTGYYDLLRATHPGTYRTLEDVTSPISTAIAMLAGRPILARVEAPNLAQVSAVRLTSVGAGVESFALPTGTTAQLTIISPDDREAGIVATMAPGGELRSGASLSVRITDGSGRRSDYPIDGAGLQRLPVHLTMGLNRLILAPVASATNPPSPSVPAAQQLLFVQGLSLAAAVQRPR